MDPDKNLHPSLLSGLCRCGKIRRCPIKQTYVGGRLKGSRVVHELLHRELSWRGDLLLRTDFEAHLMEQGEEIPALKSLGLLTGEVYHGRVSTQ